MLTFTWIIHIHLTENLRIMTSNQKPASNATTGSQVVKYRKLRPTNPKPFKLRTDVSKDVLFLLVSKRRNLKGS